MDFELSGGVGIEHSIRPAAPAYTRRNDFCGSWHKQTAW